MKDILLLNNMLTPKIITFVYWLLLIGVVAVSIDSLFFGYVGVYASNPLMVILYAVGGAIGARILCELLIVLFKMNEALQEIRKSSI